MSRALKLDLDNERHRVALREALDTERRARAQIRSLSAFVRGAWHVVEPGTPLEWAPYLDVVCGDLERVARGEIRNLVVCLPPGAMKSLVVSVFFQAWLWLRRPSERVIAISATDDLATRDNRRMRDVVRSDWYRALVAKSCRERGETGWEIVDDQNEKVNFENSARGFRQCSGIDAHITGKRGDGLIVDDTIDAKAVVKLSPAGLAAKLREVCRVSDEVLTSRLNDQRTGWRIDVAQMLDLDDLPNHRIRNGATPCVFPITFEPDHPLRHPRDPRTVEGEPLHPQRHTPEVVATLAKALGRQAAGQLWQRPVRLSGGLVLRDQFVGWPAWASGQRFDETLISVDATFKKADANDYVAIGVWGRRDAGWFFLRHQIRRRMNYPETREALRRLAVQYPEATTLLIEEAANGPALIDDLRGHLPLAVIGYQPKVSKYARAQAVSPLIIAGQVFVPDPTRPECPEWVREFLDEWADFPGLNDDQVDQTSQALLWWTAEDRTGDDIVRQKEALADLF